ncbi:MAG: hypothetical protein ED559_06280 [Phycisphaera sp.]|nr:MAG: hypothetical protein ED559_06280 [Phycisphaera sp.]
MLRDELFSGEIFMTLREAKVLIERWRNHYNTKRHTRRSVTDRQPCKRSRQNPTPLRSAALWQHKAGENV